MKKKPNKKTILPSLTHLFGKLALLAALFVFSSALIHAQENEKVQKHRGHITAIDMDAKTVTLSKKNGSEIKLEWNDKTDLESAKVKSITDLKPGMWLRCIMVDKKSDVIKRIRHEDELDKAKE